ncbi:MAG: nucleotidyltransferase domain-containing protein [Lyngbya sp. HA4199-MV5]|jgi:hypothetical protein|nr:nucleotidyltransferase domain-containing protein [Lyngbya sp. HA4199-MV5]
MLALNIQLPEETIAKFCRCWKVSAFALFGSIVRDDFRPDSDVDVLVTFAQDAKCGLLALATINPHLNVFKWGCDLRLPGLRS